MRKEKLFHLLVLLGFTLLSMTISAQTDSRDVYGWLRYDDTTKTNTVFVNSKPMRPMTFNSYGLTTKQE